MPSSLLQKARNSSKNIVRSIVRTSSGSPSSGRSPTNRGRSSYNNNVNESVDEEEGDSYMLHSTTTDTTATDDVSYFDATDKRSKRFSRHSPIVKRQTSRQLLERRNSSSLRSQTTEDYQLHGDDHSQSSLEEVHHKQSIAPFSSLFCVVQCIIMGLMMWQCGIAPMNINPMIGPYPDALNFWGAKNAVLIIEDGEVYRLITPILLHAGLIHLAGNVLVQSDAGNRWEKEWGSLVWLLIYLGSAIGSSILSTCVMPDTISVGSSGAVMGLFGGKLAEIFLLCCEKSETLVEKSGERSRKEQACAVIGGIVIVMAMSFIPYVDWAAHLGGMAAGFVIGMVCFSFKIRSWFFMLVWLIAGVGTTFALFSGALAYMYTEVKPIDDLRDVCGYYKQFFEDYECQCMLDEAIKWGSWGNNGGGEGGGGGGGDKF